jgi:hypothetical protein
MSGFISLTGMMGAGLDFSSARQCPHEMKSARAAKIIMNGFDKTDSDFNTNPLFPRFLFPRLGVAPQ